MEASRITDRNGYLEPRRQAAYRLGIFNARGQRFFDEAVNSAFRAGDGNRPMNIIRNGYNGAINRALNIYNLFRDFALESECARQSRGSLGIRVDNRGNLNKFGSERRR